MPSPKPSSGNPADRRTSLRSETTHRAVVRINPDRDGPTCAGKLQDVSAGGIGLITERAVRVGETFLVQSCLAAGKAGAVSLLYRCVRCQPRADQFLVGGILVSAGGDIERDANGRISAGELERIRRSLMAA